eukprot:1010325-Rhodomonas_salina.1
MDIELRHPRLHVHERACCRHRCSALARLFAKFRAWCQLCQLSQCGRDRTSPCGVGRQRKCASAASRPQSKQE